MRLHSIGITVYCALFVVGTSASADPIEIPNVFTPATTARAADVNENFAVTETAINDHDSRIEDNENDITALTTAVQQVREPVVVFDGAGNEIGLLIGDGTVTRHVSVLTEQSYSLLLSKVDGRIREESFNVLYYATPNCSGQLYSMSEAGTVTRSQGAVYYVDRDSTPIAINNGSYWSSPGTCANLVQLDAVWPALPNDPAITGTGDQQYQLPIKIGRP